MVGWFVVTSIAAIVENENAGNKNKNKGRKDSVSSASSRSLLSKVVEASVQTIPPLAIAAMAVTWPTEVRTTHTRVITMMTGVVMSHLSNNMVRCTCLCLCLC